MVLPGNALQDTLIIIQDSLPLVSERETITEMPAMRFDGLPRGSVPFHADWITALILAIFILYIVVLTYARYLINDLVTLLSFRSRRKYTVDQRDIFQWQSTVFNLASYSSLALFLYLYQIHHSIDFPFDIPGLFQWAILLASIALLITIRHLITTIVGLVSNNPESMLEYLGIIYMLYRILGFIFVPIIIIISYVPVLRPDIFFSAGLAIAILLYIFRIIRLLNIFITKDFSIFYFLLYLCALEILPGAILFKTFV